MGSPGFVYVMSNPAMRGLVKIGMTTGTPMQRAHELSTTGVPEPFSIEFAVYADDARKLERECHEHFSKNRCRSEREFFSVDAQDAAIFLVNQLQVMRDLFVSSLYEPGLWDLIVMDVCHASTRDLSRFEVSDVLNMLTGEEIRNLVLRYEAHCDQVDAGESLEVRLAEDSNQ